MRWRRRDQGPAPATPQAEDSPLLRLPPPRGIRPTVLVLGGHPGLLAGTAWSDATVILAGDHEIADLDALADRLVTAARLDLVVDVRRGGQDRVRALRALWVHLAEGGLWWATRDDQDATDPLLERLRSLATPAERAEARAPWRTLAHATSEVTLAPDHVWLRLDDPPLLKVRDAEAVTVLHAREPALGVSVLDELPGGVLIQTGRTTHHGEHPAQDLPAEVAYPSALLRRYDGEVTLSNAHASHGRSLLPESFRWHLSDSPASPGVVDVGTRAGRLRSDRPDPPLLPGSYYLLDYANAGHYGHLMTEAVARLWGWERAKAADPGLKLLLRRHATRMRESHQRERPELTLLPAFGIAAPDLVWFEDTVRVESVVGCTPLWHNATPHYVHPALTRTWARLRHGMTGPEVTDPAPGTSRPDRIFVTRSADHANRPCRNIEAVEALVTDLGFTVVHPGRLDLAEQAATFAAARVVVGFGGTGMFNLVYADPSRLEAVVVLNHTAYDARNEHLFAAVLGADAHFFWSEPDLAQPEDGFSYEAFQSPWAFDLPQHEQALRSLLPTLG